MNYKIQHEGKLKTTDQQTISTWEGKNAFQQRIPNPLRVSEGHRTQQPV